MIVIMRTVSHEDNANSIYILMDFKGCEVRRKDHNAALIGSDLILSNYIPVNSATNNLSKRIRTPISMSESTEACIDVCSTNCYGILRSIKCPLLDSICRIAPVFCDSE